MKKEMMYVYVSDDPYELIDSWAMSITELAKKIGVSPDTIRTQLYKKRKGLIKTSRYEEIDLSEDDSITIE